MTARLAPVALVAAGIVAGAVVGLSVAPSVAAPTEPVGGMCLDIRQASGWTKVTATVTYARAYPTMSAPIVSSLEHGREFGYSQVAMDENDDPWLMTARGNWVFAARTSVDLAAASSY